MKHSLLALLLALPATAGANCLPKEAGGTGTPLQLHMVDQGTVMGWRCTGVFMWLGTRKVGFIPFGQEDLLAGQLRVLKAENLADPHMRADLSHAAFALEARGQ